ncbi:ABC transporter substrate-binding protein [Nocardia sp. CDC159]|uniref:Putative aliphatic sulfonates-binding protein n=1 Tax=Nocardia pulmonis TaxID=2951408 RepID=A0A9X2ED45_9NOCA|nr:MULTISPECIES: ABC transporter substrate-binding protein [Nocardia]MCM6778577.1 ABC transporter substrate-binding protein [Nocardia pulmonis]MCM6791466.1 ABC transporter substrate-binding protein [Nocardia sp. CDC159]
MISRRLFAVLALTATVATACGTSDAGDAAVRPDGTVDLSQVTLRLGDQKGTGLQALLEAAGELRSVPYKLEWSQYTSGPPMLEAINSGAVDFGGVGNAPPVFAAAARSSIKIVAGYSAGTGGQGIVVPADSPLHAPNDLRGKKIAVAKGSSAHYHLLSVLTKNGLALGDVEPQYLQPADALAALTTGRVDAWAIWDPYTAQAEQQANARILVDGNGYVNPDAYYVAGAKALGSKSRTAALRDLLARIQRAHTWVNEHPDQWAQTYAQFSGLPVAVTTVAVKRGVYQDHSLNQAAIDAEQQVADTFTAAGLIPNKVKIADFVDTRFNDLYPTP